MIVYWGSVMSLLETIAVCLKVFLVSTENPVDAALRSMTLGFEIPNRFNNPDKFRPTYVGEDFLRQVPNVISSGLIDAMGADVPIDVMNAFQYLKHGRVPEYVVVYFMNAQPATRCSNSTRFFRALHLMEAYRDYILPPYHGPVQAQEDEGEGVGTEPAEEGGDGTESADEGGVGTEPAEEGGVGTEPAEEEGVGTEPAEKEGDGTDPA